MASPDYVIFVIFLGLRDEPFLVAFVDSNRFGLLYTPGSIWP